LRLVASDGRHHAARDEVSRIIEEPDELIDQIDQLDRYGSPGTLAVCEEKHRRCRMALTQLVQQCGGLRMGALTVQTKVPVEQHGAQRSVGADDCQTVFIGKRPNNFDIARFQRRREVFSGPAKRRIELRQFIVNYEGARPQRYVRRALHGLFPLGSWAQSTVL
jgi:hypothetical protein